MSTTVLAASSDMLYEIDWSTPSSPKHRLTYDLGATYFSVWDIDFSTEFITCLAAVDTDNTVMMVIRRGETVSMDRHYVNNYATAPPPAMNNIFFDPMSNTHVHVFNNTITNRWFTFPHVSFNNI